MADEVLFERRGPLGHITLNRPAALNALTLGMSLAMERQLTEWAADDGIKAVLVVGAPSEDGKVPFCAGGDIQALYEGRNDPDRAFAKSFFRHEYRLDRLIHHYPKPYIALIDGVAMGGGVGVSVNGSHRVVTQAATFAMPETGIGLFPDVGGTYFLPRCPGRTGMFLALTGTRLKWADACHVGVATHAVLREQLAALEEGLAAADWTGDGQATATQVIEGFVGDPGEPPLAALRARIDPLFAQSSVEWIVRALEAETDDWAAGLLETLRGKSPTSLKVTFRQIVIGARLDYDDCMRLEYRLARRFAAGNDFYEGIRAVVIDKDNAPRWEPAHLEEVSESAVQAYLMPFDEGDLEFD